MSHRRRRFFPRGVCDQRAAAVADVGVVPQRGLPGLQLLQREAHHLDGRLGLREHGGRIRWDMAMDQSLEIAFLEELCNMYINMYAYIYIYYVYIYIYTFQSDLMKSLYFRCAFFFQTLPKSLRFTCSPQVCLGLVN